MRTITIWTPVRREADVLNSSFVNSSLSKSHLFLRATLFGALLARRCCCLDSRSSDVDEDISREMLRGPAELLCSSQGVILQEPRSCYSLYHKFSHAQCHLAVSPSSQAPRAHMRALDSVLLMALKRLMRSSKESVGKLTEISPPSSTLRILLASTADVVG